MYSQPASSILPSDAQHGAGLFSCSQFPIFFCFFFFFLNPPQSSYMYKLFRFKPFWNPGTKAISFINHLPPTPLCPLHPSSGCTLTMEDSLILWLHRERRIPPPWLPGDTHWGPYHLWQSERV